MEKETHPPDPATAAFSRCPDRPMKGFHRPVMAPAGLPWRAGGRPGGGGCCNAGVPNGCNGCCDTLAVKECVCVTTDVTTGAKGWRPKFLQSDLRLWGSLWIFSLRLKLVYIICFSPKI